MKNVTIYHIFTNNNDDWLNTLPEAQKLFRKFVRENGCARLYEEFYRDTENDEPDREDCLMSVGGYPM